MQCLLLIISTSHPSMLYAKLCFTLFKKRMDSFLFAVRKLCSRVYGILCLILSNSMYLMEMTFF